MTQETPVWYQPPSADGNSVNDVDSERLLVTVASKKLIDLLDPLHSDPWSVGGVEPAQVETALREGRLREENPCWHDASGADSEAHAERIAWLVRYGWNVSTEPLQLEVTGFGGVLLNDGNHRLYVLAFMALEGPVVVELSGYLDIAEMLFDVRIP